MEHDHTCRTFLEYEIHIIKQTLQVELLYTYVYETSHPLKYNQCAKKKCNVYDLLASGKLEIIQALRIKFRM